MTKKVRLSPRQVKNLSNFEQFKKLLGNYASKGIILSSPICGDNFFASFFEGEYKNFYPWVTDYGCIFRAWKPSMGFQGGELIGGIVEVILPHMEVEIREYPAFRQRSKDLLPYHEDIKMLFREYIKIMVSNFPEPE